MKILLTAPYFFPRGFGGGQTYVYMLALELQKRGHEAAVVTPVPWEGGNDTCETSSYEYDGIHVISFSLNPDMRSFAESELDFGPLVSQALRRILTEFRPDIVHINGSKAVWVQVCKERNVPHVVSAHHAGLVCSTGALLLSDGSLCRKEIIPANCVPCCSFRRRPRWYTGGVIGCIPSWIYRPMGGYLSRKRKPGYLERGLITPWLIEKGMEIRRTMLADCNLIISPSKYMRDLLVNNGCDPSRTTILPHAVDSICRPILDKPAQYPVRFGYVGRIDRSKGLHCILEAAERLMNGDRLEIHIFGGAQSDLSLEYLRKTLEQYKGSSAIHNHGFIGRDKLADAYAKIDVLIAPSLLPEAFGLVVLEAFSAGIPVIVFNSGALAENVRNGLDGFVLESGDVEGLSALMKRLTDNPEIIKEMAGNIRQVQTIGEYTEKILKVYSSVIDNTSAGQN
jgi:glycosyltransferase involved in cell wall biosynthesis